MNTLLTNPAASAYTQNNTHTPSLFSQFMTWCTRQEDNRLMWLAGILTIHGCALTPITLFCVILSSNSIVFWVMALAAMGMSLVTNLAALPTKITIPVFALSILIDLSIIFSTLAIGFDITQTYL